MSTKGLKQVIADESTGAEATFHVLDYYTVDKRAKQVNVRLSGYVNESSFDVKKNPLVQKNLSISSLPESTELIEEWIYDEIIKPSEQSSPSKPASPFIGAEKVYIQ